MSNLLLTRAKALLMRAKADSTDTILQGQPFAWYRNVRGTTACVRTSCTFPV